MITKFIRAKVKVVKAEKSTINQTLSKFSSFEGYPFNLAKIIWAWDIDHNLKLWQSRVKYIYCWSAVDNHTQKCNGILLITNDNSTMSGSRIMWVLWFLLNVILITCKGELKYTSSFCDCKVSYHNLASATIYRRRFQMNVAANRRKKKNVVASTRCSWFFMQSCSVSCCPSRFVPKSCLQ